MTDPQRLMDSEARRVAKKLTEAQRRAIRGAHNCMTSHGGHPFYTVDFAGPWPEGVAQFLTLRTDRLTPLGLRVRAVLQETSE